MNQTLTSGYHTVLADSKISASNVISSLGDRNASHNDMINVVSEYMETHGIDCLKTNFSTIQRDTGLEQSYVRHLDSANLDYAPSADFSEKQINPSKSVDVQVSAKIESIEVEDLESELNDVALEVKQSQAHLNDLDEQLDERIKQQQALAAAHLAEPVAQPVAQPVAEPVAKSDQMEQKGQNISALGSMAASFAKYVGHKVATSTMKDSIKSALSKHNNSNKPQNLSSIPMQCQEIKDTINNLSNPKVCNTSEEAQKLSDNLNEQLVRLNQSMTQATKKVFNSTGLAKEKGASKLKEDLESVSSTLQHMHDKTPELSQVIDKFEVKIDMKKVQESLKQLTSQLKDALKSILNTNQSPSVSMG